MVASPSDQGSLAAALVALLLGAGAASAATLPDLGTRVGASTSASVQARVAALHRVRVQSSPPSILSEQTIDMT